MRREIIVLAVAFLLAGCARDRDAMTMMKFGSAEAPVRYFKDTTFSQPTFTLSIADGFTFAGQADTMGAGMAIVMDAILAKGFWPDGFEQKDGYRVYRYKRTK